MDGDGSAGEVGKVTEQAFVDERRALLELLAALTPQQWDRPTECPQWNVQQVALHVLGDDLSLLSRQRDSAPNGLVLYATGRQVSSFREVLDGFNEQWVTAATFLSSRLVVELLDLTGEWTRAFYSSTDPESLGEAVGFFDPTKPAPYWQIASREFVERWVHQQQIRRAVGAPDLDDDLLVMTTSVVLRGVAERLPALDLDEGRAFGAQIAGLRGWTLRRNVGRWSLTEGVAADVDATLTWRRDAAAAVFSRAPRAEGGDAVVSISGDERIGRAALGAISAVTG